MSAGTVFEAAYYGVDGQPKLNTWGYAKIAFLYDEAAAIVQVKYFDNADREIPYELVITEVLRDSDSRKGQAFAERSHPHL